MNYQPSEIVNLILLVALSPIIIGAARNLGSGVARIVYLALGFLLGAYVFTILEGFVLSDLFNMLEHVCYALTALSFLALVRQASKLRGSDEAVGR